MKKLYFLGFLVFSCLLFYGQSLKEKNSFRATLTSIVNDYPNQFKNLLGDLLVENPQSTDFSSKLNISGAVSSVITKYSAAGIDVYSWEALILITDDFAAASKKFTSLFGSINNLTATLEGRNVVFKGASLNPIEEKKFSSIRFQLADTNSKYKKLKIELLLEAAMLEWTVRVLIYETEREDDERGRIIEH